MIYNYFEIFTLCKKCGEKREIGYSKGSADTAKIVDCRNCAKIRKEKYELNKLVNALVESRQKRRM